MFYLPPQACWMLQQFSEVPFKNVSNLQRLIDLLSKALCEDKELPVRVEAAIAIQHVLVDQEKGYLSTFSLHIVYSDYYCALLLIEF